VCVCVCVYSICGGCCGALEVSVFLSLQVSVASIGLGLRSCYACYILRPIRSHLLLDPHECGPVEWGGKG
jgi:hypothetical protein